MPDYSHFPHWFLEARLRRKGWPKAERKWLGRWWYLDDETAERALLHLQNTGIVIGAYDLDLGLSIILSQVTGIRQEDSITDLIACLDNHQMNQVDKTGNHRLGKKGFQVSSFIRSESLSVNQLQD